MNDALWLILPIAFVIVVAVFSALSEWAKHSGCWHKWGKWQFNETGLSYTQRRTCEKCGYTEVQQRIKLEGQP